MVARKGRQPNNTGVVTAVTKGTSGDVGVQRETPNPAGIVKTQLLSKKVLPELNL